MSGYGIYGDFEELEEMVKGLKVGEEALKKATASAVNKTAVSCRAFVVKKIREDYNIRAGDIRAALNIYKANKNQSRIEAQLYGDGSPGIPLSKFSPTPRRVPSTIHQKGVWQDRYTWWGKKMKTQVMVPGSDKYLPKAGIKVMVRKGRRKLVRDAFVAQMPNGKIGVFRRKERGMGNWWNVASKEAAIEQLYGPSPIRLIDSDYIQIPLDDFAGDTLDKNMQHEAEFYLAKAGLL